MKYDFDKLIDRRNSSCLKWGSVESVFGAKDVLPMWVGDFDLATGGGFSSEIIKLKTG